MDAYLRRERHEQLLQQQQRQRQQTDQSRVAHVYPILAGGRHNAIDLTDSRSPSPSSSGHGTSGPAIKTSIAPSAPRTIGDRPLAQSWSLPARNKHAAPSKVRMVDVGSMPPETPRASPSKARIGPSAGMNGQTVIKTKSSKVVDAFALDDEDDAPQVSSQRSTVPGSSYNDAFDVDKDIEDRNLMPQYASMAGLDASIPASERDAQLQAMLSNMVMAPELGDVDIEKSSRIEGLRCRLLPHQVVGYLWLKGREAGSHKGGILADDMGLGKTIQMLALLIGNGPKRADRTIDLRQIAETASKGKSKALPTPNAATPEERLRLKSHATLVVAPLAVIRQWEREIKEKSSPQLKVLVHHGPHRTKDSSLFGRYDVVITTYTTATSEFANINGRLKKTTTRAASNASSNSSSEEDSSDENSFAPRKGGKPSVRRDVKKVMSSPLYECEWLRVILDEAQNIKNHKTQVSSAAAMLSRKATSKWCLSGTPIQNDCLELFSLIRFLAIPPFDNFAHFKEKIADPLKSTNQNRVNWGMKRLCAVLGTIMLRRTKDATYNGQPILSLPKRKVQIVATDFQDEKERSVYDDLENQVKKNISNAEDTGKKMNHMVTLLMLLRLRQACNHPSLLNRSIKIDAGAASATSEEKKPSDSGTQATPMQADDEDDDGLAALLSGLSVVSRRCDRCQVDLLPEEAKTGCQHCKLCRERLQQEREENQGASLWSNKASTKIRTMLGILDEIRRGGREKTIIFSQFTSFLDLIESFLRRDGHTFARYDGSLRPDERERALERIRNDDETRIILISFKAGNTGLNLTSCSRVILMDLWWNPMLEAQAIDRAHRLGQTRPVVVYKVVIQRSVEERILQLQDKKRALAEAALEGSKLTKQNRLDRNELMYLFNGGPVA